MHARVRALGVEGKGVPEGERGKEARKGVGRNNSAWRGKKEKKAAERKSGYVGPR